MTENDSLLKIVADTFDVPMDTLTDASSQDSIPEWDSLGMVRLVTELEIQYCVEFDLLEMADFKTVGIIRSILLEKGAKI